ncbi:MAG TPA: response regulator [Polyangiaceae bacterium]|nr:response regulator [Polyangiaceae bacterium]
MGRGAGQHGRARGGNTSARLTLATTMRRDRHVILVVDDDHDLRESLREILEEEGFETVGASNGREAIEFLRREGQTRPRVILLDIMMPVMTGLEMIERLHRDVPFISTPVVFMTAFRTLVKTDERTRVLYKPFSIDCVLSAIRQAC